MNASHFSAEKWQAYAQLMRLDKPIGTLLLLWPTYWALLIASEGLPSFSLFVIFTLGVVVMRSAGCVINDYADRHFDGEVKRTANRPLASGRATENEAKGLFLVLLVIALVLALLLNSYALYLSLIGALLAIVYPFMKRLTHLPQVVLGMAFGWCIPMAFGAVLSALPLECWLLFIANLVWTVAYDTQYAMVDRDDDLRIGIKSTAILFGKYDNLTIALLQGLTLLLLILLGILQHYGISYFALLLISLALFVYQAKLTKTRQRAACFQAFLNNHYVGMSIFAAICAGIWL